ncbi:hypothetical protein SLS58_003493 [Diplodia intermedia]|uniref:Uncharacterized protein n=1 Tax=Diplodia intermedia TaxID=856260 RepID=A0ABR3TW72_9PEZI
MGLNQDFSHPGDCPFARNKSNAASDHSSSTFTFYAAAPSAPLNFSHHAHATRNDTSFCPLLSSTDAHDDNDGAGIRLKKKRKRTDNDAGTAGPIRKKRRLRLTLITSRLSQPFAVPTTHIADRGRSRIAAWAKQQKKAPWGRALLRKAATLNRATRRSVEQRAGQSPNMIPAELEMLLRRKGVEMARLAWLRGSLATSNYDSEGTGEGVERDGLRWSEDDAEQLKGKVEKEKKEEKGEGEEEENESAYFDSLIFGIAASAVVAADSPALSNTSVFVSDYDRLDDLAGDSNTDGFASSVLSSPARASSPSATTVATALTALTDEDDAATGPTADRYSSGSPSSMLFFDQLLETIPSDGEDAIVPPPLLPLEQTQPSVSKRPPRPKGWNPNFASAPPPPPSSSKPLESSE